jgi:hypothetical protein
MGGEKGLSTAMSVFAWMFAGVIVDLVDKVLPLLNRRRRDQ